LKKTLVLGIGNDILTDDGIGPKIINDLKTLERSPELIFETTTLGGLEILEIIKEYKKVIIIDAIRTIDGKPGEIYFFNPDDFKETLHLSNLHDINFLTALELGEKLGIPMPEEIHIIAIEIVEDQLFGTSFTPVIEEKYNKIMRSVKKRIEELACQ
jgi:hydrogenase maturation protease